jgi:phosphoribosyl 1,2-cyclic phosphate phosphodiesterase
VKITMLGCGGSQGVPSAAGDWGACDPAEPRNYRRRVSVLIEQEPVTVLIDTSPDLREQLLSVGGVRRLDGVLFTHSHADHLHGIDDLRSINRAMQEPIPVHADGRTLAEIRRRFGYVLEPLPEGSLYYRPVLAAKEISGPFSIGPLAIQPFDQDHGYSRSLGFRIGDFAYSTDVVMLDEAAFALLEGVRVWIVDAVRPDPHPTHSHLARTLDWIARLRPERAVLTHMDQTMDYRQVSTLLPPGVEPGYDGLVIEI